jgi:hypothetical protein
MILMRFVATSAAVRSVRMLTWLSYWVVKGACARRDRLLGVGGGDAGSESRYRQGRELETTSHASSP